MSVTVLACAAVIPLLVGGTGAARSTALGPQLYVSPSGSDAGACNQSAPCASFDRAYHSATPGTTVIVQGGSYPSQTITRDPSKDNATANVLLAPVIGATVRVGDELRIEGTHIEFRNMSTPDWYATQTAAYITLRNLDVGSFYVTGASHVSVIGGDVGPYENGASEVKACVACASPPHDILVDGVRFHDYTRTNGTHVECLHVYPVDGMVVRNSRFQRCAIIDLGFFQYGSAGATRNVVVENNFFDAPTSGGSYSVDFDASLKRPITNVLIRNNSSLATMLVDTSGGTNNVRFVANIGPRKSYHCYKGVEFSYNVWDGTRCGPTDTNAPSGFVDPVHDDLHLLPQAAAIGHGSAADQPARDIDGQLRPDIIAPDAGADQREPVLIVAGRAIGAIELGMSRTRVVAHYGAPKVERRWQGGPATVATYSAPRGQLSVIYANGTVVGAQTTSTYYETADGVGPGRPQRSLPAGAWLACRSAYRRTAHSIDTLYSPTGGRYGRLLRSVTIVRRSFDSAC